MTKITTKRRIAGQYLIYINGICAGDLYQDLLSVNDPWRYFFTGAVRFPWWSVMGPYRSKRDAIASLQRHLDKCEQAGLNVVST